MQLKKRFLVLLATAVIILFVLALNMRDTGPREVEGWHRNQSRNMQDYIKENLEPVILPESFCTKNGTLLVMILSRVENFNARNAIRETWAQKRDNVSFFFLLGETQHDFELQSLIYHESRQFRDIIQERFLDHYNNLTLKTVNMLKLFNKRCSRSHQYLMKIDDDVFLNIGLVMKMLARRTTSKGLLLGKIINNTKPFRTTSSKWYVPYEWYPEEWYPAYLCGPAYLMSGDVARKLYECALETPLFYIEDVFTTGICAEKVNVAPQEDPHFSCVHLETDLCHRDRDMFVHHLYNVREMRECQKKLLGNGCQSRFFWASEF